MICAKFVIIILANLAKVEVVIAFTRHLGKEIHESIFKMTTVKPSLTKFGKLSKPLTDWKNKMVLLQDRYTYRVTWSEEDGEHVGLCAEFPGLSWLSPSPEDALRGIRQIVADVVADMGQSGEKIPEPIASRQYSGKFLVRVPPEIHRRLALEAAEAGVSLNRLASAKLAQT
jgi:predicted HicB family RNase H-like nuclease